jgi:hypothetical protein
MVPRSRCRAPCVPAALAVLHDLPMCTCCLSFKVGNHTARQAVAGGPSGSMQAVYATAVRSRRHQPLGAQAQGGRRAAVVAGRAAAGSCPMAVRLALPHGRAWPGWHARGIAWPPWMARWRCCPHWRCNTLLLAWPGNLIISNKNSPSDAEAGKMRMRTLILNSSAGHACLAQACECMQSCAPACMLCSCERARTRMQ